MDQRLTRVSHYRSLTLHCALLCASTYIWCEFGGQLKSVYKDRCKAISKNHTNTHAARTNARARKCRTMRAGAGEGQQMKRKRHKVRVRAKARQSATETRDTIWTGAGLTFSTSLLDTVRMRLFCFNLIWSNAFDSVLIWLQRSKHTPTHLKKATFRYTLLFFSWFIFF